MSRFTSFSRNTAPIILGKQTVRFSPEDIEYVERYGCFPEGTDSRGDYMHLCFIFQNGARTATAAEDKLEYNPKYLDNIKVYFDGKVANDGYNMKVTFDEIRKRDKRYKNMTAEEILGDLLYKEFDLWFYRYESKGKGYLQVAWNAEQYKRFTEKKKPAAKKKEVPEEEIPFDI